MRIDDKAAMRTAVDHLAGLGHTRIGYIGAVPQNVAHIQTPQDRLEAFLEAVGEPRPGVRRRLDPRLGLDRRGGRRATRAELLSHDNRPTAIVAASDEMAIGVRESARRLGLGCPRTCRSSASTTSCSSGVLGLTTVRQDVAGQGHAAADLLLRALLDDDESHETHRCCRPSSSCASRPAPPRGD